MTLGALVALLALAAAMLPAGVALARVLVPGASRLERLVIGAALGRIAFAAVTLVLAQLGALALAPLWCAAGVLAWALVAWRGRGRPAPQRSSAEGAPVIVACLLASALLVHGVVARSGREVGAATLAASRDARGDLLFYGRDSTNDPLVYLAMALRLEQRGLPLSLPFAGGGPATSTYVPYAVIAGAHALAGGDGLDIVFRAQPFFDVALATLAAAALAARLGAGTLGAGAAGVLLALGSEPSFLAAPLGTLAGRTTQPLDSWALFGPYLLAFNPIAPALGAFFAALLLLAAPGARALGSAIAAGVLVASLFETKLFLFAPVLGGLALAALWRPPRAASRVLRAATVSALAAALPSLIEKLLWARRLAGRDDTTFQLCPGCLPRYLVDAAWGSHELSFVLFRDARPADVLAPAIAFAALGAITLCPALALGARAFAAPALRDAFRAGHADDDEAALRRGAVRVLGFASILGLALALLVIVAPHYLNGAQFAWSALFGLWPLVGVAWERALRARRLALAALVLFLALPSTAEMLARLGYGAKPSLRVAAEERALLAEVASRSQPGDLVLEPSMLENPDRPSAVPWLAGRPVALSLLSAVLSLPESEREARFERLLAVYAQDDPVRAEGALRASGARFVLATPRWPLRGAVAGLLEPVATNAAGTLYRVRDPAR